MQYRNFCVNLYQRGLSVLIESEPRLVWVVLFWWLLGFVVFFVVGFFFVGGFVFWLFLYFLLFFYCYCEVNFAMISMAVGKITDSGKGTKRKKHLS